MNTSFPPDRRDRRGLGVRKRFVAVYVMIVLFGLIAVIPLAAITIAGWDAVLALQDSHDSELAYSLSSGFYVPTTLQGTLVRVDADFDMFSVAFGASSLVCVIVLITASYGLCLRSTENELAALVNRRTGQQESVPLRKRVKRCVVAIAFTGCCIGVSLAVAFPLDDVTAFAGIAIGVGIAGLVVLLARKGYRRVLVVPQANSSDPDQC